MDDEKCKAAFIKAGYWPNEVMWAAWRNAWKQATEIEQERIVVILYGIDQDECSAPDVGWWETSAGVEFGEGILAKIRHAL